MDTYLLLGIIGMILVLVAFLLNQANIWKQSMLSYDFFNFLGSFLLLLYAYNGEAWPFFVLNMVWALYSLKDVLVTVSKK